MGIKQQFSFSAFERDLKNQLIRIDQSIINSLIRLGEDCVKMSRLGLNIDPSAFPIDYGDDIAKPLAPSRSNVKAYDRTKKEIRSANAGEYIDQTANLRSSIGYVIIANGQVIKKNFQGTGEGTAKGKQLATKLAADIDKGFALIVVAGEKYAVHLEAKGYNVIASSEKYAKDHLRTILKQLS